MLLRPFLNDAGSCASYLFGCTTHGQARGRRPARRPRRRLPRAAEARSGAPIVAVFETHVQADHVSGLPALVERDRRDRVPARRARASSSTHVALADGERRRARQHGRDGDRDARPRAGAPRLRSSPTAAAARRALARVHRRLAAGRRRRPAGPARARRAARRRRALLHASLRAAARAARPRRPLPEPLRRLGLRPRPLRATRSRRSASSAATTRCSRSPTGRVRRRALRGHPAAARSSRQRSSPPTAPARSARRA